MTSCNHEGLCGRMQAWLDVRGVAVRQAGRLDAARILRELRELCDLKETPETVARARDILEARH